MKRILVSIALVLSCLFSFMANANEAPAKVDKHEGIEITVNINSASAEEIAALLKGIGIKKAQQIVADREANGPFQSAEDLARVKGIGPSTVAKNQERIKLE
ncbi:transporter [Vibrio navarrensis]|nr:ComEA family DNA-binding protein [Vibrio navarrensis]KGK13081.1 transporter [Vibrio navarrensis]KGK13736.1 transporter [Vibrio navarrensis]